MKAISTRQLLITLVPSIFILLVIVFAGTILQISMLTITRDIASIAGIHPLSGILSNLGILLWCASASICGFASILLRNVKPRDTFWFLLFSSLLSTYILFDDFFLFHEFLASQYLGLSQKFVVVALGVAVFAHLIKFRRIILRTHFGALMLAIGLLATSVVIDTFFEPWLSKQVGDWTFFFEDGAKWLGIAFWCSYYMHTSHKLIVSTLDLPNNAMQSYARNVLR